jgi:hypothetical protein
MVEMQQTNVTSLLLGLEIDRDLLYPMKVDIFPGKEFLRSLPQQHCKGLSFTPTLD